MTGEHQGSGADGGSQIPDSNRNHTELPQEIGTLGVKWRKMEKHRGKETSLSVWFRPHGAIGRRFDHLARATGTACNPGSSGG